MCLAKRSQQQHFHGCRLFFFLLLSLLLVLVSICCRHKYCIIILSVLFDLKFWVSTTNGCTHRRQFSSFSIYFYLLFLLLRFSNTAKQTKHNNNHNNNKFKNAFACRSLFSQVPGSTSKCEALNNGPTLRERGQHADVGALCTRHTKQHELTHSHTHTHSTHAARSRINRHR